ncbi:MAG: hypothetical protein ACOYL0_00160 [Limnohabitans sp.]|nr:hypothetical protein [Burkholderiales bacterium]
MKTNHQIGIITLIKRSRPINLITGPIIYSMIFPIALLDLCVSFYQWTCFPVYGIPKFLRRDFIIFDRQELKYLDWVSKFHCTYCAYSVGVVAFVTEVIEATEAYFCPIKHKSKKDLKTHLQWKTIAFEQAPDFDFAAYLDKMRSELPQATQTNTQNDNPQNAAPK